MAALEAQVATLGACSLPGVSIAFELLAPLVQRAVRRGFVSVERADFVLDGLRFGFRLGIDVDALRGKRWFRNYPTALEGRSAVTKATKARVDASKTLALLPLPQRDARQLPWPVCRVFPLGAVPKPLEPSEMRPVSDHTRSGLKAVTDLEFFRHTLRTYDEIAAFLRRNYYMRVSDIDAAFPLLPLAPALWPFFLFWWYAVTDGAPVDQMWLYMHVCGDFGAAGLPGTWKIFFTDVIVGVARSEEVLTLPMAVYVDDCALIGAVAAEVDAEGAAFTAWLRALGIYVKELKDRAAAQLQLALGFWWDSIRRTRTLDEVKLFTYVQMLKEFAKRRTLSLREMQQIGGRMQRAVLTLPQGAMCFLAALFALMRGLRLPWQQRRTTRAVRADFAAVAELLNLNLGKGFFSFDHMGRAPAVYTDASKEARYAGGGYVSMCGRYRWWSYGGSAARRACIDFLEGDAVLMAVRDLASYWRGMVVPLYIDNRSFQLSAAKGWSRAERLSSQLRELFTIAVTHECVFEFHWISTHDNVLADALSRAGGEPAFLERASSAPWHLRALERHASSGSVRRFGPEFSSDDMGDGPPCYGTSDGRHVWSTCPLCGLPLRGCLFCQVWLNLHVVYCDCYAQADRWQLWRASRDERLPLADAGYVEASGSPGVGYTWHEVYNESASDSDGVEDESEASSWGSHYVTAVSVSAYSDSEDAVSVESDSDDGPVILPEVGTSESHAYDDGLSPVDGFAAASATGVDASSSGEGEAQRGRLFGRAFSSDEDGDGPATRGSGSSVTTFPYSRASVFVGLPTEGIASRVNEVLDERLSASSQASVNAALGHWRVLTSRHRWPEVIASDDPSRGGKLAAFALYLLDEAKLAGTSISNYLWALRSYMKFCRQLDPAYGVAEWDDFTMAVLVAGWVQSEPHRAVPIALLRRAINAVDLAVFAEVQIVVLVLVLLFTFARSETPCPKSLAGFDPAQHLQVRDVVVDAQPDFRVRVRLKRIKQDARIERDEARAEGGDLVCIGDVPNDNAFSIKLWLRCLFRLHGSPHSCMRRPPDAPFFVHSSVGDGSLTEDDVDGVAGGPAYAPLTYAAALRGFRAMLARVTSADEAASYGLHGLRVQGYNLAKAACGVDLAVAQGGWHSTAHERYERFSAARVLAMPQAMIAGAQASIADVPPAPVVPVHEPVALAQPPAPPPARDPQLLGGGRRGKRSRGADHGDGGAAGAGSSTEAAPAPAAPRPLLGDGRDVGRVVLCPRAMWPKWQCKEHGGEGWEARIEHVRRSSDKPTEAQVAFANPGRAKFQPMWVQLDVLRPL